MRTFLKLALAYDWLTDQLAKVAACAVLLAALISAGNAIVRFAFDTSSNGWLEVQWCLFSAAVMLGAPVVLKLNEHVRVDIFYGQLKGRRPVYVDLSGLTLFLLPTIGILAYLSGPLAASMLASGERFGNAGGLVRWPVVMLLPLGFGLVFIQGLAEIIKRVCYLQGIHEMNIHYEKPVQ